jgi:LacI family transcriptional regulator
MPNQRTIAAALGLNQSTVSLALRDDPSVAPKTKARVLAEAKRVGYTPNSYVSSLMTHIRKGKPITEKGSIALLVDAESFDTWCQHEVHRNYRKGLLTRATELGFNTEPFYLQKKDLTAKRVDEILYNRGIRGVVLTAPWTHRRKDLNMQWDRYSSIVTGQSHGASLDQVTNDQHANAVLAYEELISRGYKRISLCLPAEEHSFSSSRWLGGFSQSEHIHFGKQRTPVFFGSPADTKLKVFTDWLKKNRPEVIITLVGHEMEWLNAAKIKVPDDLALVCLVKPPSSDYSGIAENNEQLGRTTLESVAYNIRHNQFGLPKYPRLTLIKGNWVDGTTC